MRDNHQRGNLVYIVDGNRTPFIKAKGKPGPFSAADLAVQAARPLLERQPFEATEIDEVILGCVMPDVDEANIARIVSQRIGCGIKIPAWTVQRNCASGLQAIDSGARSIRLGDADLVLVGGTESMSRAPLLFPSSFAGWMGGLQFSKTLPLKLKALAGFRPAFLKPVIALLKGLCDPVVGINMGQTAEELAYQYDISREKMDTFASGSHQAARQGRDKGHFSEITPIFDPKGRAYTQDEGVRDDSSPEKLAKLRAAFDKKYGNITPGNSSQITDGAAMLLLASEDAVKKYKLPVLGRIVATQWSGLDPRVMGLGPAYAISSLMSQHDLTFKDIDNVEINEAFSAQVLACVEAFKDKDFNQDEDGAVCKDLGTLDPQKLNVDGGAIAIGHPLGASGARIVLHLLNTLKRDSKNLGIASLCIGGGQGGAILVENKGVVA